MATRTEAVRLVCDLWRREWKRNRGGDDYVFVKEEDAVAFQVWCMAKGDKKAIQRRIAKLLARQDQWALENVTLSFLPRRWNCLVDVEPQSRPYRPRDREDPYVRDCWDRRILRGGRPILRMG